jgi:hypothetical protein
MAEKDWRMMTPCAKCPFVNKQVANSLRPGRLSAIKDNLRKDGYFLCHKTVKSSGGDGTNRQCAGAIQWQETRKLYPNQNARICQRLDAVGFCAGGSAQERRWAAVAIELTSDKRPKHGVSDEIVRRERDAEQFYHNTPKAGAFSGTGVFRCSKCKKPMEARPVRETFGAGGVCGRILNDTDVCNGLIEMVPAAELPKKKSPWEPITDNDVEKR